MRASGLQPTFTSGFAIFVALAFFVSQAPRLAEADDPVLYDQEGTIADTGSIRSYDQTDGSIGEKSNEGFGADDITVPANTIWHITAIRVHTQFPPTEGTWNAIVYNNNNGNVGAAIANCTIKGIPNANATVIPMIPPFPQPNQVLIPLPPNNCYLQPGTYWLSVYSAGNFPGAFFNWTSRDQTGLGFNARFKNGGPGMCGLWSDATTCSSTNGKVGDCFGTFNCARALDFTLYGTLGAPDLTVAKTKNVASVVPFPTPWTWTLHVANDGSAAASFSSGQVILTDGLQPNNLTYGLPNVTNISPGITGTPSCSISALKVLTCTASGTVMMPAPSSFDVQFTVDAAIPGTFTNPGQFGICKVDPQNVIFEVKFVGDAETNNSCADGVTQAAPDLTATKSHTPAGDLSIGQKWTWKNTIANSGNGVATFAAGQVILLDNLPDSNITYSNLTTAGAFGLAGTVNCTLGNPGAADLKCLAGSGGITLSPSGHFDVKIDALTSTAGTYANPRPGDYICRVDPNGLVTEVNGGGTAETNNSCSDSVTVKAADLIVSKATSAEVIFLGSSITWTLHVSNDGDGVANFAAGDIVLRDDLPSTRISIYGSPTITPNVAGLSCSVSLTFSLTCTAGPGGVKINGGASFDVKLTVHPNQTGIYSNPRTRGVCAVDPADKVPEDNRGHSAESNNSCNAVSVTVYAGICQPDLRAVELCPAPPLPNPGPPGGR